MEQAERELFEKGQIKPTFAKSRSRADGMRRLAGGRTLGSDDEGEGDEEGGELGDAEDLGGEEGYGSDLDVLSEEEDPRKWRDVLDVMEHVGKCAVGITAPSRRADSFAAVQAISRSL